MGEKTGGKMGGKRGEKIEKKEKTDENSGHYVIASSQPPEWRWLERRTLVPIKYLLITIKLIRYEQVSPHRAM